MMKPFLNAFDAPSTGPRCDHSVSGVLVLCSESLPSARRSMPEPTCQQQVCTRSFVASSPHPRAATVAAAWERSPRGFGVGWVVGDAAVTLLLLDWDSRAFCIIRGHCQIRGPNASLLLEQKINEKDTGVRHRWVCCVERTGTRDTRGSAAPPAPENSGNELRRVGFC